MVGVALTKDIGSLFQATNAKETNSTGGGSGDNTFLTGAYVDKSDFCSCKVIVAGDFVAAALNDTLTLTVELVDATDSGGTGSALFGTAFGPTAVFTAPGAATTHQVFEFDFNIEGARQFVAFNVKPHPSGTNTFVGSVVLCLGGAREEPCSKRLN